MDQAWAATPRLKAPSACALRPLRQATRDLPSPGTILPKTHSSLLTRRWRKRDSNSRSPRRGDNRRDLSQLSAAAAFSTVAERTGLNAGCPSALFEEAAAFYSLRTQRPDRNCKAVRKAWATAC